jgi:hypothetical protein
MAALSKARMTTACRVATWNLLDRTLGRRMPRRCTLVAIGLALAGLSIPLGMAVQLLPITLLLAFLALVLLAAGGGLLLTQCGQI